MHELAMTQSVVDMVMERTAGRRVASVHLQVDRPAPPTRSLTPLSTHKVLNPDLPTSNPGAET